MLNKIKINKRGICFVNLYEYFEDIFMKVSKRTVWNSWGIFISNKTLNIAAQFPKIGELRPKPELFIPKQKAKPFAYSLQ